MRVLVVEDDPDLQDVVAGALRQVGYAVDTASDGREGLVKARSWTYDAIVLDLMLPQMNGFEVIRELRKHFTTPVLILTARDSLQDRVVGLDQGADDYLVKPFEIKELQARLRALIRRSVGQAKAAIEIGPVSIDTAARTVTRQGESVTLTAREYALVELLAMHRKKLVSRSMIYDHLFDENDDSLSNLVEVHISNVRKKLGRDFIKTRRGLGYVIDE
jgi:two-component system, OmpR family, response regulator